MRLTTGVTTLRKLKAGYIGQPAFVRWPSWEIDVAASIDTPEGRIVRLFTERPIAFEEMYYNTRSRDFEFGVAELRLNEKASSSSRRRPSPRVRTI